MTLDEVVAQLYALPPEEFTAARGEAVAAARTAGDRDLAKQIGALRRPTVAAWLVNLLAHQRPDLIGDLLALGDAMRTAQRKQVVAFRTFLRTFLHELCHHLDYELLRLAETFHTEGFYKRESSLFRQLVVEEGAAGG